MSFEIEPFMPPVVSSELERRPQMGLLLDNRRVEFISMDEDFDFYHVLKDEAGTIPYSDFTGNGSKIYDDNGPEACMPECEDPFELNVYTQAYDAIEQRALARYALERTETDGALADARAIIMMLRRRVIDCKDKTWACHDNLSISGALAEKLDSEDVGQSRPQLLLKHLMMRSFISGAGLVRDDGLYYTQKMGSTTEFNDYGYLASHFRVDSEHSARLEVRSSDRSVNNAAAVLRVGALALTTSLMSTPLAKGLSKADKLPIDSPTQGLMFDTVQLTKDRTLVSTAAMRRALRFERRLAEASRDELSHYVEVPKPYQRIARMWVNYVDKFDEVLQGDAPIDSLAPWSDWARKFGLVLDYVAEDPKRRTVTDDGALKIDQDYDLTKVVVVGDKWRARDGVGVRDQKNPKLPCTPAAAAVVAAEKTPPNTRAKARVEELRAWEYVTASDWQAVAHTVTPPENGRVNATVNLLQPNYIY